MIASNEVKQRFDRAKQQYESLLLNTVKMTMPEGHEGANDLFHDHPLLSLNNHLDPLELSNRSVAFNSPSTPAAGRRFDPISHDALYQAPFERTRSPTNYEDATLKDKEDIIISLQQENDRLRQKLNFVLESAEKVLKETQDTNAQVMSEYEARMQRLQLENRLLLDENHNLKSMLDNSQQKLSEERDHLQSTMKLINRFRRRSQDYLDIQRKLHSILKNPDGLHYTALPPRLLQEYGHEKSKKYGERFKDALEESDYKRDSASSLVSERRKSYIYSS